MGDKPPQQSTYQSEGVLKFWCTRRNKCQMLKVVANISHIWPNHTLIERAMLTHFKRLNEHYTKQAVTPRHLHVRMSGKPPSATITAALFNENMTFSLKPT